MCAFIANPCFSLLVTKYVFCVNDLVTKYVLCVYDLVTKYVLCVYADNCQLLTSYNSQL